MGVLFAKVGADWVPVSGVGPPGADATDEVEVGTVEPTDPTVELWFNPNAVPTTSTKAVWQPGTAPPALGLMADVVVDAPVAAPWANAIRDRSVQVFAESGGILAWAAPDGTLAFSISDGYHFVRKNGAWQYLSQAQIGAEFSGTLQEPMGPGPTSWGITLDTTVSDPYGFRYSANQFQVPVGLGGVYSLYGVAAASNIGAGRLAATVLGINSGWAFVLVMGQEIVAPDGGANALSFSGARYLPDGQIFQMALTYGVGVTPTSWMRPSTIDMAQTPTLSFFRISA